MNPSRLATSVESDIEQESAAGEQIANIFADLVEKKRELAFLDDAKPEQGQENDLEVLAAVTRILGLREKNERKIFLFNLNIKEHLAGAGMKNSNILAILNRITVATENDSQAQ